MHGPGVWTRRFADAFEEPAGDAASLLAGEEVKSGIANEANRSV
jgi:hypothetical protein